MTEQQYKSEVQDERERLDRANNVIRSEKELIGWRILHLERWKPGVVKVHRCREFTGGMDYETGFASDALFAAWQLPP